MSDKLREALRLFFNTLLSGEPEREKVANKNFVPKQTHYPSGGGGSVGGPQLSSLKINREE